MMNNNKNMNAQFDRMKQLMNFGLNESKKQPYTGVEYSKVAADGKLYGIVREGTKFYIKVSSKKDNVLAENFEYIGGFRNRKDNEYSSFASAQKNFDFKLRSLAEAYGNGKNIVVESWNPDRQEELTVESTEKMKKEISRERQIMENAMKIFNRKPTSAIKPINEADNKKGPNECGSNPFCIDPEKEFKDSQKATMNEKPSSNGDAKKANGYKNASTKNTDIKEGKTCEKCGKNPCVCGKDDVNEASEKPLGWNREDPDYMDKSHGTEIGDSMPFDGPEARNIDDGDKKVTRSGEEKQGTIHEEDTSMIYTPDNQNSPKPGVGEIGDDNPFDDGEGRQIDEAIDDLGDGIDDDVDGEDTGIEADGDLDLDGEGEVDGDTGIEADDDLDLGGEEAVGGDLESRIDDLEAKLDQILDAINDEKYADDDLYPDNEEGEGDDDEAEFELETDDESGDMYGDDNAGMGDEEPSLDDEESSDDDEEVFESRAYRAMKIRESARRNKARRINEAGMKPFRDAGRVPSGNMNKLDDFGKHPAYQKVVMSLPPKDLQEFPDYYDMNDDSVRNDSPYGERIGDGAPFDIDPEAIDNAIAESVRRILKKKR